MPPVFQDMIKQHDEEDLCDSDGEATQHSLKFEKSISYEEKKQKASLWLIAFNFDSITLFKPLYLRI